MKRNAFKGDHLCGYARSLDVPFHDRGPVSVVCLNGKPGRDTHHYRQTHYGKARRILDTVLITSTPMADHHNQKVDRYLSKPATKFVGGHCDGDGTARDPSHHSVRPCHSSSITAGSISRALNPSYVNKREGFRQCRKSLIWNRQDFRFVQGCRALFVEQVGMYIYYHLAMCKGSPRAGEYIEALPGGHAHHVIFTECGSLFDWFTKKTLRHFRSGRGMVYQRHETFHNPWHSLIDHSGESSNEPLLVPFPSTQLKTPKPNPTNYPITAETLHASSLISIPELRILEVGQIVEEVCVIRLDLQVHGALRVDSNLIALSVAPDE